MHEDKISNIRSDIKARQAWQSACHLRVQDVETGDSQGKAFSSNTELVRFGDVMFVSVHKVEIN